MRQVSGDTIMKDLPHAHVLFKVSDAEAEDRQSRQLVRDVIQAGKQGSGLLLSHLMFMLFLIFSRNMIIKALTSYAVEM